MVLRKTGAQLSTRRTLGTLRTKSECSATFELLVPLTLVTSRGFCLNLCFTLQRKRPSFLKQSAVLPLALAVDRASDMVVEALHLAMSLSLLLERAVENRDLVIDDQTSQSSSV